MIKALLSALAASACIAACAHAQECPAPPASDAVDFGDPVEVSIATDGDVATFLTEIADEPAEHSRGLMFRPELARDRAMLFDFGDDSVHSMWMQNTCASLDMLFLRADGSIAGIAHATVPFSRARVMSPGPVRGVLEIAAGRARALGIRPGDTVQYVFSGMEPALEDDSEDDDG